MNYKDTNKRAQFKIYFVIAEREYLGEMLIYKTIQNKKGAPGVLFFEKSPGSFEVSFSSMAGALAPAGRPGARLISTTDSTFQHPFIFIYLFI